MASVFLYGTLCHLPLLEVVLGRAVLPGELSSATADGIAVRWAEGERFPLIEEQPGATARGLLLRDPDDETQARLDHYELGFGYDLRRLTVRCEGRDVPAVAYFPPAEGLRRGAVWSLDDWAAAHGARTVEAAREVMGYMGRLWAAEAAERRGSALRRADARLRARQGTPARDFSGRSAADVEIAERRQAYSDFFAFDEYRLSFPRFGGGRSDVLKRGVFVAFDAALVLPYDPVRDEVLLVEQMRMGPLGRGDAKVWQIEPVAGHVDPGERPEDAARREAAEEAGLTIDRLEKVAELYASPGCSTEYFYIYVGLADLSDQQGRIGGVEGEAEDIRRHVLSFDALMELVDAGGAPNAPLMLAALWLARHRDRLRAG